MQSSSSHTVLCPPSEALADLVPAPRLILPADPRYQLARTAENQRFNSSFPCAVVLCQIAEHVTAALNLARRFSVPFRVRSGGHSYEGLSLSDGIIIDLSHMNNTQIDLDSGTATVGPGATLMYSVYVAND